MQLSLSSLDCGAGVPSCILTEGRENQLRNLPTHNKRRASTPSRTSCSEWIDLPHRSSKLKSGTQKVLRKHGNWIFAHVNPNDILTHDVCWPKAFHYAKELERGAQFPPVKVSWDEGTRTWRSRDGAHRVWAGKLTDLPVLVKYKQQGAVERTCGVESSSKQRE